jgi:mannosyltransferase
MTAGIALAAFAIRCIGIGGRWLTGDELWSASLAKDGMWTALVTTARFDVHPPLYYLQLSLWMLLGHSDQWLMLNSVLWGTIAVALLSFAATEIHGPRVGLAAGAMLAVAPAALAYGDDVRMYSMLLALIVLAWYAQARWLRGTGGRLGALWMIASQVAMAYSHGAALVMLSGIVLLGGVTPLLRGDWRQLGRWIGIEVIVGALVAPTVLVALMRGVSHAMVPDFATFLQTWTFLTTGESTLGAVFVTCSLIVLGVLLLGAAMDRGAAPETGMLVFAPLILAGVVSHVFKPIWLDRTFLFTVPFICLGLARAPLDRGVPGAPAYRYGTIGFVVLILGWLGLALPEQVTRDKGDGFKPAAALVHQMQRPGDLIVCGPDYTFWYFLWYYGGRHWGEPRHAFILSEDWKHMMARLPGFVPTVLGLSEADRTFQRDGVTITLWDPDRPVPKTSGDIILVGLRVLDAVTFPGYHLASKTLETQVLVERWVPDARAN